MDGLIHIYCGDGKGKTTCALGLGVRACGCAKRVLLAQFLKADDTGERKSLSKLQGFFLLAVPKTVKFTFRMTEEEKTEAAQRCRDIMREAASQSGNFDMLILDEVFGAIQSGVLEEEELLEFLRNKPKQLELVLTGRNPSPAVQELADYITEMKKIKHPYEKGIPARRGIEF